MRTTGGIPMAIQKLQSIKKHFTKIDKNKNIRKHGEIKKHPCGLSSWHEGKE